MNVNLNVNLNSGVKGFDGFAELSGARRGFYLAS